MGGTGEGGLLSLNHADDDVLAQAAIWTHAGRGVALATVISTWGSSPRPAGSQLAVDEQGHFVGSVSGGCVEISVIEAAREVLVDGNPRRLSFGVTSERAWEVGLACGGRIQVYVNRIDRELLAALLHARATRRSIAVVTDLDSGTQMLVSEEGHTVDGEPILPPLQMQQIRAALSAERSFLFEDGQQSRFIHVLVPPARLIIVGAVHIASALVPMAAVAGYRVILIDPRHAFASRSAFAAAEVIEAWPDEALTVLAPDRHSAIVTLTHDPKLDDVTLKVALASSAFYIGALGSRKTQAARRDRLTAAGFSESTVNRIHGPIGLAIGAVTPAEIAIAILAELTQSRRLAATQAELPK